MTTEKKIIATDLEDFDEVDVVEILVEPGEEIEKGQSIVTLESDKAMMEFPSPEKGTVKSIAVDAGNKVKQGDTLIILTCDESEEIEKKVDQEPNQPPEKSVESNKTEKKVDQESNQTSEKSVKKEQAEQATENTASSHEENVTITATDLEDFDEVDVVEILVEPGEEIEKGQSIVTLESDKAMMEFPSPESGVVQSIAVEVGDKVKQGDALVVISTNSTGQEKQQVTETKQAEPAPTPTADQENAVEQQEPEEKIILATELEDFDEVDVVEILVEPGEEIEKGQSIVTLESDKAMMEFPSPESGVVQSIAVEVGDKVKQGDQLIVVTTQGSSPKQATKHTESSEENSKKSDTSSATPENNQTNRKGNPKDSAYASPAVRKYAGELGVNLEKVTGSAEHGRVLKDDVQSFVKEHVAGGKAPLNKSEQPLPDFSQYGPVEKVELNKLRQISAQRLAHAWQVIPHVTQFEEADITDLENARKQLKGQVEEMGAKLSILPFIMKALVKCLAEFPDFNSSINEDVTGLIHKKYFHIGIAVDTPRGLLVPVIKDVDQKKIPQLAQELMEVSTRAREGKLSPKEMQGGCMSITSLGGIGGQYFTPIVNQPEVAILGVSRAATKLQKVDGKIIEKLMLPLSLSYDHRAIDGVAAVKFALSLKNKLSDVWSLML